MVSSVNVFCCCLIGNDERVAEERIGISLFMILYIINQSKERKKPTTGTSRTTAIAVVAAAAPPAAAEEAPVLWTLSPWSASFSWLQTDTECCQRPSRQESSRSNQSSDLQLLSLKTLRMFIIIIVFVFAVVTPTAVLHPMALCRFVPTDGRERGRHWHRKCLGRQL